MLDFYSHPPAIVPAPPKRTLCECGNPLEEDDFGWCKKCRALFEKRKPKQVRVCACCGHAYIPFRLNISWCSLLCRQALIARHFWEVTDSEWTAGWVIKVHALMLEVYHELYSAPFVVEQSAAMPLFNVLDIPRLNLLDGRQPATRRAVGKARPPRRDNVVNAVTHIDNLGDTYEDILEKAYDWADERI